MLSKLNSSLNHIFNLKLGETRYPLRTITHHKKQTTWKSENRAMPRKRRLPVCMNKTPSVPKIAWEGLKRSKWVPKQRIRNLANYKSFKMKIISIYEHTPKKAFQTPPRRAKILQNEKHTKYLTYPRPQNSLEGLKKGSNLLSKIIPKPLGPAASPKERASLYK